MLALAHDYRVMRTDKGVLYLSEVRADRTLLSLHHFQDRLQESVNSDLVSDHPDECHCQPIESSTISWQIDIGLGLRVGTNAVVRCKMSPSVYRTAALFG
jgi:hypothetical protein